jgi:peptidoglycan/LPS O-acetylase OafA/YrhL
MLLVRRLTVRPSGKQTNRFELVDGLRGLAALAVIVPHATGLFAFPGANRLSLFFLDLAPFGAGGVEVFFVVSGFAIAYSLRDTVSQRLDLGRFVLRRAVRLDPPYWAGLLLYGATSVLRALVAHQPIGLPQPAKVLAHVFYLQDLLRYGQFNVVFWTLCLEFQLYLVFAALTRAVGLLPAPLSKPEREVHVRRDRLGLVTVAIFVPFLLISHTVWPFEKGARWFVPFFYLFLAGALVAWRVLGRISDKTCLGCLLLMSLGVLWAPNVARLFGVVTAFVIYLAARRDRLHRWLSARPFQWLGRISYSIYLVHVPVAILVLGLRARVAPTSNTVSLLAFVGVYAGTLALAYLVNLTIESPCLRLAQRLKPSARFHEAILHVEVPRG